MSSNTRGFSTKKRRDFADRRSERMSHYGREFENIVGGYLTEMKGAGVIEGYVQHIPYTPEDFDGRDFTVTFKVHQSLSVEVSFGITISHRRWLLSCARHPHIHQFFFPVGTNKDTIKRRVLELCKKKAAPYSHA